MTLTSSGSFERNPVREATLDDLNIEKLNEYLLKRVPRLMEKFSLDQVMERLGMVAKAGPQLVPTVAGILIFGDQPQILHPQWGLSAVRIKGKVMSDGVAALSDIEGSIPHMLEQGLDFIRDNSQALPNQLELDEKAEEYPSGAVREALVNALIHRDWHLTGRVALRIFDDRLEIWNPGGPLPIHQVPLEELSSSGGISMPRNPLIAATCRFLGIGEQLGRGLPTIRRTIAEKAGKNLSVFATKTDVCLVIPSSLHVGSHLS